MTRGILWIGVAPTSGGLCLKTEIYSFDGAKKTNAEAFLPWAIQGYDQASCEGLWEHDANPDIR